MNPHAPSGQLWAVEDVAAIADAFDGVLLLDEAYVDFVDPERGHDAVPLTERFDNVLILRSMSKGYALTTCASASASATKRCWNRCSPRHDDSYNVDHLAQTLLPPRSPIVPKQQTTTARCVRNGRTPRR